MLARRFHLLSPNLGTTCIGQLFRGIGWKNISSSGFKLNRNRAVYLGNQKEQEQDLRADFLSRTLQCPLDQANDFLEHNPRILSTGRCKFHKFIELFKEHKISTKDIFSHPDIFRRNHDTIKTRFQQVKQELGMDPIKLSLINTGMPIYSKRFAKHLREKEAREVYSDKSTMLMSHMGCSRQEAAVLIQNNDILRDSKLSTLRQKLELLITQGIPTQMILDKTWILTVPLERLETRSKALRKDGILFSTCPKSYFFLLKCQDDSFWRNLKKWTQEKEVLGDSKSRRQFLLDQLDCEDRQIDGMIKSYPSLLSVGAVKLNATLHFLQQECTFSSEDIVANGILFRFGTETLKDRYEELKTLGCENVTAKLLCTDSRAYVKLVEQLEHQLV